MKHYTCYVDGSGDLGWTPPYGKSKTKWYTLAGIILNPEQDLSVKNKTDDILKKFITLESKRNNKPNKYELHHVDLMNGHNIYKHLTFDERKAMENEFFNIIVELEPIIIATSINKVQMKKVYEDRAQNPKHLAIRSLIAKFSMFLDRHESTGMFVFDEEETKTDKKMRVMMQSFREKGVNVTGYVTRSNNKLTKLLNTLMLCPSELSPGIQCADFIARAVWINHMYGKSQRYTQIAPLWESTVYANYRDSIIPSKTRWK